jgi:hypothetical protein
VSLPPLPLEEAVGRPEQLQRFDRKSARYALPDSNTDKSPKLAPPIRSSMRAATSRNVATARSGALTERLSAPGRRQFVDDELIIRGKLVWCVQCVKDCRFAARVGVGELALAKVPGSLQRAACFRLLCGDLIALNARPGNGRPSALQNALHDPSHSSENRLLPQAQGPR